MGATSRYALEKDAEESKKSKNELLTFRLYYQVQKRTNISLLLPNNWVVTFIFFPQIEAEAASKSPPTRSDLLSGHLEPIEIRTSNPRDKTRQASLHVGDNPDPKPEGKPAAPLEEINDSEIGMCGYWLPNGIFVRRIEIKLKDDATPPSYAGSEIRYVGCPLDDEGLALVRFVAFVTPRESFLPKLMRKLTGGPSYTPPQLKQDWMQPPKEG